MKNQIYQKPNTLIIYFFAFLGLFFTNNSYSEDYVKNNLKTNNEKETVLDEKSLLIPIPTIDIESINYKINILRNPFDKPSDSEISNTEDLYSTLLFKGIAGANNFLFAIIESGNIQKFYKVGDTLDNGFIIKSISMKDISVDISNGTSDYRLSLTNFKNSL
tara:strand:- start:232 stop:717 length:486 start_codon:yes stop_codon:yes gene_type:complete